MHIVRTVSTQQIFSVNSKWITDRKRNTQIFLFPVFFQKFLAPLPHYFLLQNLHQSSSHINQMLFQQWFSFSVKFALAFCSSRLTMKIKQIFLEHPKINLKKKKKTLKQIDRKKMICLETLILKNLIKLLKLYPVNYTLQHNSVQLF